MDATPSNSDSRSPLNHNFGVTNYLRGILGAIVGGAIGLFLFRYLYQNNLYAPLVLGGALGFGASLASGGRSLGMAVICFILGAGLTLIGDWSVEWFAEDDSFLFYLKNLPELGSTRLLMVGLSTLAAGYFGAGR